jgi:hypothetical protein
MNARVGAQDTLAAAELEAVIRARWRNRQSVQQRGAQIVADRGARK